MFLRANGVIFHNADSRFVGAVFSACGWGAVKPRATGLKVRRGGATAELRFAKGCGGGVEVRRGGYGDKA